jgi:hypothetical protein
VLLLIALEASAEGCWRLLNEWTRILDWLGPLGPEGIASTEFNLRRDNIKRALQLVGVPFSDPEDPPVTTTDPLTAPFVRAWQALNDRVMTKASGQELRRRTVGPPPSSGRPNWTGHTGRRWAWSC